MKKGSNSTMNLNQITQKKMKTQEGKKLGKFANISALKLTK
jgi:hypothetical protein